MLLGYRLGAGLLGCWVGVRVLAAAAGAGAGLLACLPGRVLRGSAGLLPGAGGGLPPGCRVGWVVWVCVFSLVPLLPAPGSVGWVWDVGPGLGVWVWGCLGFWCVVVVVCVRGLGGGVMVVCVVWLAVGLVVVALVPPGPPLVFLVFLGV